MKWHGIVPMLKEKNYEPKFLHSEKIPIRNEGEIKMYSDEGKLRIWHKHVLQEWLKFLYTERKYYKEGIWNIRKEKRTRDRANTWYNSLSSPLEFPKICLLVETNIKTLFNMNFIVYEGNI